MLRTLLAASVAACAARHAATAPGSGLSAAGRAASAQLTAPLGSTINEITSLPGFTGKLPSAHYSGYVTVDATAGRQLFYYFATSEGSASDPVVLWLNGGPGCSSFDGLIYEHGPFVFKENAATPGGADLVLNPYSWNKAAHVIYLDSPAGVGLSYSTSAADYITGDIKTSIDSDAFLRGFFTLFPQFQNNPFYISGESYAGIYVPTLAARVIDNNAAGVTPKLNLVGYLVGNGCTDDAFDGNALVPYALGKSLISVELAEAAAIACGADRVQALSGHAPSYWNATPGSDCYNYQSAINAELAGLNIYDTLEDCITRGDAKLGNGASLPLPTVGRAWPLRATLPSNNQRVENWKSLGVSVPCVDATVATKWLNTDAVRVALGAQPVAAIGSWEICTNNIYFTHDAGSMIPYHKKLLAAGVRALIYSGDHDMCVPHTGSEAWTASLGMPVASEWHPWRVNGQVAGYSRSYAGGLTYATVKGAGHTVPEYKPSQALFMLKQFLAAQPL